MTAEQIEKGTRLGRFISTKFRTQKAFAQAIGVTQGFVSQMISGKSGIPVEVIEKISNPNIGLNPIWLLSGTGEMFLQKNEEPVLRVVGEEQAEYAKQDKRVQAVLEVIAMVEQVSAHYDAMAEENRQMREEIAALKERVSELESRLRMDG